MDSASELPLIQFPLHICFIIVIIQARGDEGLIYYNSFLINLLVSSLWHPVWRMNLRGKNIVEPRKLLQDQYIITK